MRKKDMLKCSAQTTGRIVEVKSKGLDFPTIVTVTYHVAGKQYQISESKKYRNVPIKLGFLTIGQKKIPKLGDAPVGSEVLVSYDPAEPGLAYLPDNIGKENV